MAEETGLKGEFEYRGVYHERVKLKGTETFIEDKVFHLMFTDKFSGKMIRDFEGGRNAWRNLAEMEKEQKKYKSFDAEVRACLDGALITESVIEYEKEEF